MGRTHVFPIAIAAPSLLLGLFYLLAAIAHVEMRVFPLQNVGFGPGPTPWTFILFCAIRGVFGLLLSVAAYKTLTRRTGWFAALLLSLIAINAANACAVYHWMPAAREVGVSVFVLFPAIMLVELAVHLVALVLCVAYAASPRRVQSADT